MIISLLEDQVPAFILSMFGSLNAIQSTNTIGGMYQNDLGKIDKTVHRFWMVVASVSDRNIGYKLTQHKGLTAIRICSIHKGAVEMMKGGN
jgi:hypothetical protein